MLRTFHIVFPMALLASFTVLGLAAIYNDANFDVQMGPDKHIRIKAPERAKALE